VTHRAGSVKNNGRSSNQEAEALKRFYVASSFRNIVKVRFVAQTLESKGYVNTYDWTHERVDGDAGKVTIGDLRSIGQRERDAVIGADVVVILLPGGKGTHVELGIAIAQGRRTILHSPDEAINNLETTSTFYHLPELEKCHGTLDDLVAMIVGREVIVAAV
jgi:nucleoside 2-deoxyribosyltransferase